MVENHPSIQGDLYYVAYIRGGRVSLDLPQSQGVIFEKTVSQSIRSDLYVVRESISGELLGFRPGENPFRKNPDSNPYGTPVLKPGEFLALGSNEKEGLDRGELKKLNAKRLEGVYPQRSKPSWPTSETRWDGRRRYKKWEKQLREIPVEGLTPAVYGRKEELPVENPRFVLRNVLNPLTHKYEMVLVDLQKPTEEEMEETELRESDLSSSQFAEDQIIFEST